MSYSSEIEIGMFEFSKGIIFSESLSRSSLNFKEMKPRRVQKDKLAQWENQLENYKFYTKLPDIFKMLINKKIIAWQYSDDSNVIANRINWGGDIFFIHLLTFALFYEFFRGN